MKLEYFSDIVQAWTRLTLLEQQGYNPHMCNTTTDYIVGYRMKSRIASGALWAA